MKINFFGRLSFQPNVLQFVLVAFFFKDPVYYLVGPGNYLDDVNNWDSKLEQLGGQSTAYWPNNPTKLDKEVLF